MATLVVTDSTQQAPEHALRLRDWLSGHWAIVFSNPQHFAPHPSTPPGFLARLSSFLERSQVKALTLVGDVALDQRRWLDEVVCDPALVALEMAGGKVIDFAERTLARRIGELSGPFVIVLDANGCCRSTISYRPSHSSRLRTVEDILRVIGVLRSGGTPALTASGEDAAETARGLLQPA
jgi:alkyl hydroperoxide reductase subunit AhpC